jgi:ADP-ribose pyrophosphatase YjhB (NUDIX family)
MPEPRTLVVALTAIFHRGSILLLRRIRPPYEGYWSLPGGKIDFGEEIPAAALREAREETGLTVSFDRIAGVATETIRDAEGRPEAHFILFLAKLSAKSDVFVSGPEGELAWYSPDALPGAMIPTDRILCHRFVHGDHAISLPHFTVSHTGGDYELLHAEE